MVKERRKKHKPAEVIAAIRTSGGIKAAIAAQLGVHRHTVDSYIARWPTVAQAYANEVEAVGDAAEQNIIRDIVENHSIETSKWYAVKKLRSRGYADHLTLSFEDLEKMPTEELERIAQG